MKDSDKLYVQEIIRLFPPDEKIQEFIYEMSKEFFALENNERFFMTESLDSDERIPNIADNLVSILMNTLYQDGATIASLKYDNFITGVKGILKDPDGRIHIVLRDM